MRVLIGGLASFFLVDRCVLGVRYELSMQTWAVRSKPTATGMVSAFDALYKGGGSLESKLAFLILKKLVYWVVGFGDSLRGEKGERKKLMFSKPFHPTHLWFLFFCPPSYKALKASNHLLYIDNMSNETLGLRSSSIWRKSAIVNALGLASLSIALPDSKNSPMRLS